MNWMLVGLLAYVGAQLLVGVAVSSQVKTEDDYLLAGRRLGLWLGSFSVFATWFGAETCIGSAGKVYAGGMATGNAEPFGYAAALFFTAIVMAVPLYRGGYTTLADLLRTRFSPAVESLGVILMIPSAVLWSAAQIKAFGGILSVVGDVDPFWATLIATGIVVAYTAYGGLLADAYTDLIQGITVIAGMAVIIWFVVDEHGGISAAWNNIDASRLSLVDPDQPWMARLDTWAIPIFGSMVAPELISRLLATRSAGVARTSCLIASAIYLVVGLIPVSVGLLAVKLKPGIEVSDHVLTQMAESYLPGFLFVLFSGALVSAILSTVDTALLVAGSLSCHNFIFRLLPSLSETSKVRITRMAVVVSGIVSYGLTFSTDSVFELVVGASALGTAGMFVVVMFGLFTKFGGASSALTSLCVGTGTYCYATYFTNEEGICGATYVPAVCAALASYIIVGFAERALCSRAKQGTDTLRETGGSL